MFRFAQTALVATPLVFASTAAIAGGLAEFPSETYAVHPAGAHPLILGKVQRVVDHQLDRPGLLFEGGVFGRFAPFQNPA